MRLTAWLLIYRFDTVTYFLTLLLYYHHQWLFTDALAVWMDITDPHASVPLFNSQIVMKVSRVRHAPEVIASLAAQQGNGGGRSVENSGINSSHNGGASPSGGSVQQQQQSPSQSSGANTSKSKPLKRPSIIVEGNFADFTGQGDGSTAPQTVPSAPASDGLIDFTDVDTAPASTSPAVTGSFGAHDLFDMTLEPSNTPPQPPPQPLQHHSMVRQQSTSTPLGRMGMMNNSMGRSNSNGSIGTMGGIGGRGGMSPMGGGGMGSDPFRMANQQQQKQQQQQQQNQMQNGLNSLNAFNGM